MLPSCFHLGTRNAKSKPSVLFEIWSEKRHGSITKRFDHHPFLSPSQLKEKCVGSRQLIQIDRGRVLWISYYILGFIIYYFTMCLSMAALVVFWNTISTLIGLKIYGSFLLMLFKSTTSASNVVLQYFCLLKFDLKDSPINNTQDDVTLQHDKCP